VSFLRGSPCAVKTKHDVVISIESIVGRGGAANISGDTGDDDGIHRMYSQKNVECAPIESTVPIFINNRTSFYRKCFVNLGRGTINT
jgi:hypothetical protein